jgi:polyisoprenoid-binding protein YceI
MKSRYLNLLGALALSLAVGLPLSAQSAPVPGFELDRSRSSIEFMVDAKIVDVKGSFRSFRLDGFNYSGTPEGIAGSVVVWPASVFTRDRERDEHLRQDDFFWVEKYPTSRVTLQSIEKRADGLYDFLFTLQIRDKVQQYTVPTKVVSDGEGLIIEGTFEVDRTDFDLNGEHVANLVMDNDVQLTYRIALKKSDS